jgi:hypothetical protein
MSDTNVMIHVRFAPDGTVTEIGERPATLAPQLWFNTLSLGAGTKYQALAGGRGVFRLTRDEVTALQPPVAA